MSNYDIRESGIEEGIYFLNFLTNYYINLKNKLIAAILTNPHGTLIQVSSVFLALIPCN